MEPIHPSRRLPEGHTPREALPSPDTYRLPMHPAHSTGPQKLAKEALTRQALAGTKVATLLSAKENVIVAAAISTKILKEAVGG